MNFSHVCLESIGFQLPDIIVTSDEIEQQLQPLYERLKLPTGRLELITGIQERRFWPAGMPPSSMSIRSGQMALDAADVPREDIGCLIHASVCRDHLEPATACRVHHELGLPRECLVYDVSNACLGLLNGALQIAQMIELGQIPRRARRGHREQSATGGDDHCGAQPGPAAHAGPDQTGHRFADDWFRELCAVAHSY